MAVSRTYLAHRIVIERPTSVQNENGGVVPEFAFGHTAWASIEPLRGRDAVIQGGLMSESDTKIKLRWTPYLSAMDATWRLRHTLLGKETIYNVQSASDVDSRHQWIEVLCNSGLNDG